MTTLTQLKPLPRVEISEADMKTAQMYAAKAMAGKNHHQRVAFVAIMLAENAQLVAEIEMHRATLGYEPLPVWKPK